jgi:hypothetical protein
VVAQNVMGGVDRGAQRIRLRARLRPDAAVLHRSQQPSLIDPGLIWIDQ